VAVAEAQSAGAPKSDHEGKTGYDTLGARMGLYHSFFTIGRPCSSHKPMI